jgi:arginine deiminase
LLIPTRDGAGVPLSQLADIRVVDGATIIARRENQRQITAADTVFTLLDRDKATAYPSVVNNVRAISLRPGSTGSRFHVTEEESFVGAVADALGVDKLHIVETGGDAYQQEREQWDDGNNVVALEPGVVVAYERNTYTISKMREAGVEVIEIEVRAREGSAAETV